MEYIGDNKLFFISLKSSFIAKNEYEGIEDFWKIISMKFSKYDEKKVDSQ
jgi:hypothetical protein